MPRVNGDEAKRLRERAGLSQESLAEASVLSVRTIHNVETGGNASIESVKRIARALKVELGALLVPRETGGTAAEPPTPVVPVFDKAWWREHVVGRWTSRIEQPGGPGGRPYTGDGADLHLWACGDGVAGRYEGVFEHTVHVCEVQSEYLFERWFRCHATPVEPKRVFMFNSFYVSLCPMGNFIDGTFAGFGPHTGGAITGKIWLRKVLAFAESEPTADGDTGA